MTATARSAGTIGPAGLARRQLRFDRGPAALLAFLSLVVAAIVCAAPAAMAAIGTAEIRHSVGALSPNDRNLMSRTFETPSTGPAPAGSATDLPDDAAGVWGRFAAALDGTRSRFPQRVQQASGPGRFVVRSDVIELTATPADTAVMQVKVNVDPYLPQHLSLAAGRWPTASGESGGAAVAEVALAQESAGRMGWKLGDERTIPAGDTPIRLRLVGLLVAGPEDPDYPKIIDSSTTPEFFDDGNTAARLTGNVFVASQAWKVVSGLAPLTTTVWFPITESAFTVRNSADLAADLRRATTAEYPLEGSGTADPGNAGLTKLQLASNLPAALDAAQARVVSAQTVQTVAVLGPCGAALAVLSLCIDAFLRRRQPAIALLISRGASLGQLRRSLALQGLLIGLPAALIAVLATYLVFRAQLPVWAGVAGVVAGLVPAVTLPVAVSGRQLRSVRSDFGGRSTSPAARIVEIVVIAAAAVSLYLLLAGGLSTDGGRGTDVMVAAAPILLTLGVCVLVIRAYPIPLRAIQVMLRHRRGAVGYLGAVRSLRDPLVGVPLILAAVTGVAVSVFSVVTLTTVDNGIHDSGIRQVGADLSVTGGFMTPDVAAAAGKIPGVAVVSAVGSAGQVTVHTATGQERLQGYFVDSKTFAAVQHDVPGAPTVPGTLAATDTAAIPAVVPDAVRERLVGPVTTDSGRTVEFVGGGTVPAGFSASGDWVLIDSANADRFTGSRAIPNTLLVAETPGADDDSIDAALAKIVGSNLVLQRPRDVTAALRAAPTISGMRSVLFAATALGGLLMALAVVITAVAGTRARNRVLSVLRVLGLNRRQVTQLASWEQAPPVGTAVLVGSGFGVALAALIRSVVDLRAFTGDSAQPPISVQLWWMIGMIGGFLVVVAAAITMSAMVARRAGAAALIRAEE